FELHYSPDECRRADRVNLVVSVVDAERATLVEAPTRFNAKPDEKIDVVLPGKALSEYDRVKAAVELAAPDVPLARLTAEQIAVLSGETGFAEAAIIALVASAKAHAESESVDAKVFYALFRQGLSSKRPELLKTKLNAVLGALDRSADGGIVSL